MPGDTHKWVTPMYLDSDPIPCSYSAMVEQREKFLRTGKGPRRFTYHCDDCRCRNHCERRQTETDDAIARHVLYPDA